MKEKRNKIILLAAGIILYFVFGMLDSMRAFSAPIQTLFSILHYAGMICMIFRINYFGTTYIYKKQAQLGLPVRELIEKTTNATSPSSARLKPGPLTSCSTSCWESSSS